MISINVAISTSAGGIETLIRSLQTIYSEESHTELFITSSAEEIFERKSTVDYINVGEIYSSKLDKIKSKISLYNELKRLNPRNQKVFIFHPTDLLYIPSKLLRKNQVILVQTNRLDITFTKLGKFAMSLKGNLVSNFTVYTEFDKQDYLQTFPMTQGKISVIPRGCRIETFEPRVNNNRKLITIARINEGQKCFSQMLEIMEGLPNEYQLDIYGSGSDKEIQELNDRIRKTSANVFYCGSVTDVEKVLREHSIFIMTSNFEGFGQTLIEARSQGLPIILYNTFTAARWIVHDRENGYLVENKDVHSAVQSILELEDPNKYKKFCSNAISLAYQTDPDRVASLWRAM
jgi:glycosyltransferase involved in cell wall biosynthesis